MNENIFNNNQIPIAIDARVRENFVAEKNKAFVEGRQNNFGVQCN